MPETALDFNHNQPVYSVSEVSQAIKRVVEDKFGVIRIRGEISGHKLAASGHAYFRLKDENAVMDAVCWRGTLGKIGCRPEDGLEVICTGRITTYPGKSSYQIVVDRMEPAGVGALMALLEKRRKALAEEGLFAPERKKPLPFLPSVVGVITSPTGAVIRDILHRLSDRFPLHVIVWPVMVQGEGAAEQIAAAIQGFNSLNPASGIPNPEVLIVARGGGSIEDLWAFNEEIVVRAASTSKIPLISAVGHETDTTLIDHASDQRAPTPTAAAEMAVPVREELWLGIKQLDARLVAGMQQQQARRQEMLAGLARGLLNPAQLLQSATQRLDDWGERLLSALPAHFTRKEQQLALLAAHLKPQLLFSEIKNIGERLDNLSGKLLTTLPTFMARKEQQLMVLAMHIKPQLILTDIRKVNERLNELQLRIGGAWKRYAESKHEKLQQWEARLNSVDYRRILERGFALVKDASGKLVTSPKHIKPKEQLRLVFADGESNAEAL